MTRKKYSSVKARCRFFDRGMGTEESSSINEYMSVIVERSLRILPKEEFNEIDRVVMGCAFDSQNELGRFCDEKVYENDLAKRLRSAGLNDVYTQVSLKVVYGSFEKEYFIDLIANDVPYELKAVKRLTGIHESQVLNYAMLLGVNRCKLINFRAPKVQGKLKYNPVGTSDRFRAEFDETKWKPYSVNCESLHSHVISLVKEWGCYLDYHLYEQGLIHYFGGETCATERCPIIRDGVVLGSHLFTFHAPDTAFAVSGFSNPENQKSHYQRLLNCSPFASIQWINFHHRAIHFETLLK